MNFGNLSWGLGSGTMDVLGMLAGEGITELPPSSTWGMANPQKTSSLVKVRYHLTSSLSSHTLSANWQGSSPVGGSFCFTQYWRALAYATTFSLGISLISQLAKIELGGGINFC